MLIVRRCFLVTAGLALVVAGNGAFGQHRAATGAKKAPCAEARTQSQLTACWSKLAREAERKVESRYQQLHTKLQWSSLAEATSAFESGQIKWREYRDVHCDAVERVYDGGSMAPMQKANCRVRLADARDAELKAVLADIAGLASER